MSHFLRETFNSIRSKLQKRFTTLFILQQARHQSTESRRKTNVDYEYIQRSQIPTMHFQASLPRLPIPNLEETCQRYLNAQRPLLNDEQFEQTKSYAEKFMQNEGRTFQEALKKMDKENRHTSYITEYWYDMYLRDRRPLPINYNPILIYNQDADQRYNDQLVKATNLVVSSLRFMKSLRADILEPEVFHLNPKKSNTNFFRTIMRLLPSWASWYGAYAFKAFPLDMSQYSHLFNSTRIPELGKDRNYMEKSARHMLVMRGGNFYFFDVVNSDGTLVKPNKIASNLNFILENKAEKSKTPVGVLTAAERDEWAKARVHLSKIGNEEILKKIDTAAFALILDDDVVGDDFNKLFHHFLHADGSNRWFDKSFSLILTKDGYAGVNFEHSWGDGVAVLRYFKDIKHDSLKHCWFQPEDKLSISNESPDVEKLDFKLDDKMKDTIQLEEKNYKNFVDSLDVDHMTYDGFGKDEVKKFGVSPDAIMQLTFQLGFYKQESRCVATYESCSTAAFKHGRTETLRPCTQQTKNVCSIMCDKSSKVTNAELKKKIVDCSKAHTKLAKEAAMGHGFDRHLFALKKMQEKLGIEKCAFFDDPAYTAINHNILSSSTLSTPILFAGGFGPVVHDGYGIGYMIGDKKLGAVVTSYKKHRSASEYSKNLESAIEDLHKVMITP